MSDATRGTNLDETALIGAREFTLALGDRFADFVPDAISEGAFYYIAREAGSAQQVRLKVLGTRTDADLGLFYLESRAAARLSHPHIVQTREAEEAATVSDFGVMAGSQRGWVFQRRVQDCAPPYLSPE